MKSLVRLLPTDKHIHSAQESMAHATYGIGNAWQQLKDLAATFPPEMQADSDLATRLGEIVQQLSYATRLLGHGSLWLR